MLHVALFEPEIPPNTGNIARLCAATGARLHLIGRLGFRIDDAAVRRAGLDYWPHVDLIWHKKWEDFLAVVPDVNRLWLVDNPAPQNYTQAKFEDGDTILFGNELRGLPTDIRETHADRLLTIPMPTGNVRSINLSSAAAVVLYEALRQVHGW